MRRKEKEIVLRSDIDSAIDACQVCHLGFAVDAEPYIVPLSFGYDGRFIYFHSAKTGKKIDCIKANPRVCFQMEQQVALVAKDPEPCKWTFHFESIIGMGHVEELISFEDKQKGLFEIIRHYDRSQNQLAVQNLDAIRVWRISVDEVTGKRSPA
jgi:nitroimidazol reductase NimA-like FMN-containing flavoprotein (pyridoxamine 5'-phosphate oxidase superfamily)